MTTESQPVTVHGVRYVKWAGGYSFGWSRRICDGNAAWVADEIAKAKIRGDVVAEESNGVIRIEGAGVYDPGYPDAGKSAPAWFSPVRTEES